MLYGPVASATPCRTAKRGERAVEGRPLQVVHRRTSIAVGVSPVCLKRHLRDTRRPGRPAAPRLNVSRSRSPPPFRRRWLLLRNVRATRRHSRCRCRRQSSRRTARPPRARAMTKAAMTNRLAIGARSRIGEPNARRARPRPIPAPRPPSHTGPRSPRSICELVVFPARADFGMRAGVDVRVDPQGDRRFRPSSRAVAMTVSSSAADSTLI